MAKEFMLLIRNQDDHLAHLTPEQNHQFLKACEDYIGKLMKEGKLKSAQPLADGGKMISGPQGVWKESPFSESKEFIHGYYHILAENIDEAIEIAKGNPEFEYTPNARVEVRPIKTKEESTSYVYPSKH